MYLYKKKMILFDYKSRWHRIAIHLLFWFSYFSFWAFLNSINSKSTFGDVMINGIIFLPVDIFATYFTIFILLPKFLIPKKYLLFTVSTVFLALFTVFLNQMIAFFIYIPIYFPELKGQVDFFKFNLFVYLVSTYTVVILAAGIKLTKLWIKEQQAKNLLETQQLQSELNLLKLQINPHFLFNTLNNIDSLIQTNPERASESLIRLSEILRYVTYDASAEFVPVEKEAEYLKSFIDLHSLRLGDKFISFNTNIERKGYSIAPMLLITLVENAIKHCDKRVVTPGIQIQLNVNDHIEFCIINSVPAFPIQTDKAGGMGLSNMLRRLELIYPNRYKYETKVVDKNKYMSVLWIQ